MVEKSSVLAFQNFLRIENQLNIKKVMGRNVWMHYVLAALTYIALNALEILMPSVDSVNIYVSLQLHMQNAVSAQPCVGKFQISLVLLNFLHCNFRLNHCWYRSSHCILFSAIFAMEKFQKKISTLSLKLNYWSPRHQTAVFKVLISFKCS